jgi:hypothetical protein
LNLLAPFSDYSIIELEQNDFDRGEYISFYCRQFTDVPSNRPSVAASDAYCVATIDLSPKQAGPLTTSIYFTTPLSEGPMSFGGRDPFL